MMKKIIFLIFVVLLVLSSLVSAHITEEEHTEENSEDLVLPANVQLIKEYNKEQSLKFIRDISLLIAFLAGILSLISPCILPTLPAFFAYSFKEKTNITKMTLLFFLGFSIVFIAYGLIAAFLGISLAMLIENFSLLVLIMGVFLVLFGAITLFGKGFSGFVVKRKFKHDSLGVFLFGIVFAVGWTACLGPILAGVLSIATILGSYVYSALLLFSYSLGIFVPLFILSFFFDKYNLVESKFLRGKDISIFGKKIHSTNLISGALLIAVGAIFIIFRNTSIINSINPFGVKIIFNNLQNVLLTFKYANIIGIIVLAVFLYLVYKFLKRKNDKL